MNKLTTDIKALHEETLNNLKTSKANNTLRAYRSDYKDFAGFCIKHGFKSMPSDPNLSSDLYINPVCKIPVSKSSAKHVVVHEGEQVYFCCDGCHVSFQKEPSAYI